MHRILRLQLYWRGWNTLYGLPPLSFLTTYPRNVHGAWTIAPSLANKFEAWAYPSFKNRRGMPVSPDASGSNERWRDFCVWFFRSFPGPMLGSSNGRWVFQNFSFPLGWFSSFIYLNNFYDYGGDHFVNIWWPRLTYWQKKNILWLN